MDKSERTSRLVRKHGDTPEGWIIFMSENKLRNSLVFHIDLELVHKRHELRYIRFLIDKAERLLDALSTIMQIASNMNTPSQSPSIILFSNA